MAEFIVTDQLGPIDFAPSTVQAEVLQNVRTYLATRQGSVPLDRAFGWDWGIVDMPYQIARAQLAQRIVDGLATAEPRAVVLAVDVEDSGAGDGRMKPTVRIKIDG
jgi:hypothetical protein